MAAIRRFRLRREGWYYLCVLAFIVGGAALRQVNLLVVLAGLMVGALIGLAAGLLFVWLMQRNMTAQGKNTLADRVLEALLLDRALGAHRLGLVGLLVGGRVEDRGIEALAGRSIHPVAVHGARFCPCH